MTDVAYLLSARAVRERSNAVLELCRAGALEHFAVDEDRLGPCADYVVETIRAEYPDLAVPYHSRWRHFEVGGVDRGAALAARVPPAEHGRARTELAIASVLLDAGAGPDWRYCEAATGREWRRSEGLAVASFEWIASGAFSADPGQPWRIDASRLVALAPADLARAFQVGPGNPLVGLEGRAALLRRLGDRVAARPDLFGEEARLGRLFDVLAAGGAIAAERILERLLDAFGPIWPGRLAVGGVALGDAWRHPALPGDGIVPFHKLSQWLAYSMIEPLEAAGVAVTGPDALTGLPEYRNGGLLIDLGVLRPRHDRVLADPHEVGSPVVVEWRALTVALLDRLAEAVRARLGLDPAAFPLAKVLQGGTWTAGRRIAAERRPDGIPPLRVVSDGTVF